MAGRAEAELAVADDQLAAGETVGEVCGVAQQCKRTFALQVLRFRLEPGAQGC